MQTPFPAYQGDEPYVFVCYSHADSETVYADLDLLNKLGLNIWYDEGISPGSEWNEELGNALNAAACVLFYTSFNSVDSRHCRDEINFAHSRDKPILSIYLEDLALPVGLELSLSSTQAIKRYELQNEAYVNKLRIAIPTGAFQGEGDFRDQVSVPDKRTRPKARFWIGGAVGLALVVSVLFFYRGPIMGKLIVEMPGLFFDAIEQEIGFATTEDNVRIAYATTGEGPPLLVVLGWATHLRDGMNSPTYDPTGLLAMTSEQFRVIRFDGRGFGLSDRKPVDTSIDGRVKDIEAVVEALQLDEFYLYGVSAGGQASIRYAARHPDKVKAMAIGSSMVNYSYRAQEYLDDWALMLDLFAASWERDSVVDVLTDRVFNTADPVARDLIRTFLRRSADGDAIHDFFMASMQGDASADARQISVPTLVVHGRDDLTIPVDAGKEIASLIPGARFEIIEGGHREGSGGTVASRSRVLEFFSSFNDTP